MATPILDRETILQAVRTWPAEEQRALAEEILRHADVPLVEEPLAPPDSQGLAGLIANGKTPPTDEEVVQWLEEHRMEKFGC
jgi:hypothetical protein